MISCNVRHKKKNRRKKHDLPSQYPSKATKSRYAYETFDTLIGARAFREDSKAWKSARPRSAEIATVNQGIQRWLDPCENEGRDGRDPVSSATLAVYKGCASIMQAYNWGAELHELEATDMVAFPSWLLKEYSRDQALKAAGSARTVWSAKNCKRSAW
jgi:hypothetical protein